MDKKQCVFDPFHYVKFFVQILIFVSNLNVKVLVLRYLSVGIWHIIERLIKTKLFECYLNDP